MKKRNQMLALIAVMLVVVAVVGIVTFKAQRNEKQEIVIQETALKELEDHVGLYDAQRILLTDTSKAEAERIAEELGAEVRITSDGSFAALYLPEGTDIKSVYENESYRKYIDDMAPDYYGTLSSSETVSFQSNEYKVPFSDASNYINLGTSWDVTKGSGTKIAIIDVGVDTDNPYISSRISTKSFNASEGKVVADYDLSVIEAPITQELDENGELVDVQEAHGTQVASVIGATYDEQLGIGGIAPSSQLVVIKLNTNPEGMISSSDVIFAIAYAIECDVNVINMSFSFETDVNPFKKYTQLAVDSDIICVASAGNESTSVMVWPAADENVIGVGAVKLNDESEEDVTEITETVNNYEETTAEDFILTDESNFGANTDVVALDSVLTPLIDLDGNLQIEAFEDTSCSSAMVSASLALYLSQNKNQEFSLVKEVLYAASKDLGTLGIDYYYGCGLLDTNALVVEEKGVITYDYLTAEFEPEAHVFVRGHTLQDVLDPERNYQVFDGWYSDIHCTDEYENLTEKLYDDVTVYASWVNEDDTEPYTYVVKDDGTAEITSYTGKRKYITIPSVIDGYTVTSIGEGAFAGSKKLRRINLPDTLIEIGSSAFANISLLRAMEIPASVTTIGASAFEGCSGLGTIKFAENSELVTIGDYAFSNCGNIRRIDLPAKVENITALAFSMDRGITTITVDSNNTSLWADGTGLYKGTELVYYASGKSGSYIVDEETTSIGAYAFANSRVTDVTLPDGLKYLSEYSFYGAKVKNIAIPDNVTTVPNYCFSGSSLESVYFGSGLSSISETAFAYCRNMSTVTTHEDTKIKSIGMGAFYDSGIRSVEFIGDAITSINKQAFSSCNNLTEVTLPASLTTLGDNAFESCSSLKTVVFEDGIGVVALSSGLFYRCEALETVVLPEGLISIGSSCFATTSLKEIYISSTVKEIGYGAFAFCKNLETIDIAAENSNYISEDNIIYEKNAENSMFTILHTYAGGLANTEYTISDSIDRIANYAFAGSANLSSITFGNNVNSVGNYAFKECLALTSAGFNSALETIETGAFADSGLVSVEFSENITSVGKKAFRNCLSLKTVVFNDKITMVNEETFAFDKALTSVTFKEGLLELGKAAFVNCISLTNVTLPESLETIGTYSFASCSSLSEMVITKNVISIGAYAFSGDGSLKNISFVDDCTISRLNFAAFANTGITSMVIPASISSMGQEIFVGCSALETVTFADNSKLTALAAWTFDGSGVKNVTFGAGSALEHIQAKAFSKMVTLESVNVDNCSNLTSIDNYAFEYCKSISEFTVPASVEEIGRYAFYGCDGLTKLVMPEKLDFIGRYAFASIPDITIYFDAPTMPGNLQEYWDYGIKGYYLGSGEVYTAGDWTYTLLSDDTVALVGYSGTDTDVTIDTVDGYTVSVIGANLLTEDSTVQTLVLPETVKTICANAFNGATNLTSVNIPASVTFMGDYAFYNTGLTQVTFAEGTKLDTIPAYAFANTKRLTSITIPDSVTDIKTYAFNESALTEVVFGTESALDYVGQFAFAETQLSSLVLPDKVTKLDHHAFEGIEELTSVEFGSGELELRGYVFFNTGLTSLTLPENIKYVGEYCFAYCESLPAIEVDSENPYYSSDSGILFNKAGTRLLVSPAGKTGTYSIPDATEVLAAGAFEGSKMTSITIGDNSNLRTIGLKAFYDCKNITSMYIPKNIQSIDYYAFAYCTSLATVEFNESSQLTGIYEGAFYGCEAITSFNVPDTVVELGAYSFYGCAALESVAISDESVLEGIYDYAFAYCTLLPEINFPGCLYDLGEYAFRGTALTAVEIPETVIGIGTGCFMECSSLIDMTIGNGDTLFATSLKGIFVENVPVENLIVSGGESIPSSAFNGCTSLKTIQISGDATYIGSYAFRNCTSLVSLQLPDTIDTIEQYAFYGCTALAEISAFPNVTYLGQYAFYNCSALTKLEGFSQIEEVYTYTFNKCSSLVELPDMVNVVTFNDYCFGGCAALEAMSFEKTVSIGRSAFSSTGLKSIVLPSCLEKLGIGAFGSTTQLVDVTMLDGCLKGNQLYGTFSGSKVQEITIGEGIVNIATQSFYQCSNLQKVSLPDSLIKIEDRAFQGCSKLSKVEFGSGLQSLGKMTFYGCAIPCVVLPDGVKSIGDSCFSASFSNPVKVAYIPASVESVGGELFGSQTDELVDIYLESDVIPESLSTREYYIVHTNAGTGHVNGDYYYAKSEQGNTLLYYAGSESEIDLDEVDGTPFCGIAARCFKGNTSLKSLSGIENVEFIGEYAFEGCTALTQVDFNGASKLTDLGRNAFKNCTALESVDFGQARITEISQEAFSGCSALKEIVLCEPLEIIGTKAFYNCQNLLLSELPDSVTEIANYAFYQCSAITLENTSDSLESIGQYAFYNCSALLAQEYPESLITIGTYAFYNCDGLVDVSIPGVQTIGTYAFSACNNLETVDMLSVVTIGAYAFNGTVISKIELPETYVSVPINVFNNIETVILPATVSDVAANAFYNMGNKYIFFRGDTLPDSLANSSYWDDYIDYALGYIDLGYDEVTMFEYIHTNEGMIVTGYLGSAETLEINTINDVPVTAIEDNLNLADGATNVKTIIMADSITSMKALAFNGFTALRKIDMSDGMETIPEKAFYDSSIVEIDLPSNLKTIGDMAFWKCLGNELVIPDSVESIGYRAFYNSSIKKVTLPENVTLGDAVFEKCFYLEEISLPSNMTELPYNVFKECEALKEILLPEGLTTIGIGAFYDCKMLTEIILPGGLTTINSSAFYGCSSLESINWPSNIKQISASTFEGCSSLTSIDLPEDLTSIGSAAFSGCSSLTSIELPESLTSLGSSAFKACKGITEITIPSQITLIDEYTFYNCSNLSVANIPDTVTYIAATAFIGTPLVETEGYIYYFGDVAVGCANKNKTSYTIREGTTELRGGVFNGCTKMTQVSLPDSLITIDDKTFYNCQALTSIVIPKNVNYIGEYAFYYCKALKEITLSEGISSIGTNTFYNCSALTEIIVPEGVTTIGGSAFASCTSLVNVELPESLEEINTYAFSRCTSLETILIPGNVNYIGDDAFANCTSLVSVKGCDGLLTLGEYAFYYCTSLTDVSLGNVLEEIGPHVFRSCVALKSITIPPTLDSMPLATFYGVNNLETLCIPTTNNSGTHISQAGDELKYIFGNPSFGYKIPSTLKNIIINSESDSQIINFKNCTTIETVEFIGERATAEGFYGCTNLKSVKLNDSITSIGEDAFTNCSSLSSIEMSENITNFGTSAFHGCSSLTDIEIPEIVETIGSYAFAGCKLLTDMPLYEVTSIGDYAFSYCTSLTEIVFPDTVNSIGYGTLNKCTNIDTITVPFLVDHDSSKTAIQEFFVDTPSTHLKSVTITKDMTEIPANAFNGCSVLEEVNVTDTVETIGSGAFSGCNLQSFDWPDALKTIGSNAFKGGYKGNNLAIPEGVESVGTNAFAGNGSFDYVLIPSTVTSISDVPTAREELRILTDKVNLNSLVESVEAKRIVLPHTKESIDVDWPCNLDVLITEGLNLESVLFTDTVEMVTVDAFDAFSGVKIYCYEDALSSPWPDGWNNDNTVFYKDKWRDITFWSDKNLLTTCTQAIGDPIKIPAKALREKADDDLYTYSFVGWDIDGDNSADKLLSTTARNMFDAYAVYSVIAKNQMEEVAASSPVESTDGSMQMSAVTENAEIEKTVASITSDAVDSISGKDVSVETDLGTIAFDSAATEKIDTAAGTDEIELSIEKVDNELISYAEETDSLYDLDLTANGSTITFGEDTGDNGLATVTVPHEVSDPENLVVYYIDESGEETEVSAYYNEEDGTVSFETYHFSLYRITTLVDEFEEPSAELKIVGATLTLQDNLAINFRVPQSLFTESGYSNPYVIFDLNGTEIKVAEYSVKGDYYIFDFTDIAPHQMNDKIKATLYADYNGTEYASKTVEYGVATYCYNMLGKCTDDVYAEFRTLLVDLLHYGAQSQIYMSYNTDNLVNASLTETQLAWGTSEDRTLTTVLDRTYQTITNPTVTWKGAGLNLTDSVEMRLIIGADSIDGLTVKVTSESGGEWSVPAEEFEEYTDGMYEVFFDGLNAGQMSEVVYLTVYEGETAVSNTLRYSIESYAYSKQNDADENLAKLVKAMMKYGDSAYAYVH